MNILQTVFNSPIHEIDIPAENFDTRGNSFYIKRDDLQPFSFGGNKVRIAQKCLLDLMSKGRDCLITYGNIRSNLCRVTANLCSALRIPCYMISVTDDNHGCSEAFNGSLVQSFGAHIVPCAKKDVEQVVGNLKAELAAQGLHPYYINDEEALVALCSAYIDVYREIDDYQIDHNLQFDYIFHASGSGTTQAGLMLGKLMSSHYGLAGMPDPKIVGISTARVYARGCMKLREHIHNYCKANGISIDDAKIDAELHFTDRYLLGGYSLTNDEVRDLCRAMVVYNGIELDPTYTGKAFHGMMGYVEDEKIENARILFIHTGGLPLFFDLIR